MNYKKNIHFSKREINILSNVFMEYIKSLDNENNCINLSNIKAIARIYEKLFKHKYKMNAWGQLPWQYLSEKIVEDLCINSQNKILEYNLNHDVKTDFQDLADFNRWEKIRTYEKQTIS